MSFERVARIDEIPEGAGLRVQAGGREIGLYRVGARVFAMENVCPHAGYPLHAGTLEGTRVICPGHGWEFDVVTGLAPGELEEEPLARYAVRIEGQEVFVDPDALL